MRFWTASGGGTDSAAWVEPDLTTWSELSGASYDHAGSTYTDNGGTLKTSDTHGRVDAGLDAGGIVGPDLGVTLSDYSKVEIKVTVTDIPAAGSGYKGLLFALIDTTTLTATRGIYAGIAMAAGGTYQVIAGVLGGVPAQTKINTGSGTALGEVVITFELEAGVPYGVVIRGSQGGTVRWADSQGGAAFSGGEPRLAILGEVEQVGTLAANAVECDFTGFAYRLLTSA